MKHSSVFPGLMLIAMMTACGSNQFAPDQVQDRFRMIATEVEHQSLFGPAYEPNSEAPVIGYQAVAMLEKWGKIDLGGISSDGRLTYWELQNVAARVAQYERERVLPTEAKALGGCDGLDLSMKEMAKCASLKSAVYDSGAAYLAEVLMDGLVCPAGSRKASEINGEFNGCTTTPEKVCVQTAHQGTSGQAACEDEKPVKGCLNDDGRVFEPGESMRTADGRRVCQTRYEWVDAVVAE